MNPLTEVNDAAVAESSSAPLDLSTKKRKRTDSETTAENGDGPGALQRAAEYDASAAPEDDARPTPLDLSRDRSATAPADASEKRTVLRPSVVVRSPAAAVTPALKVYQAPVASPLIADHVSPLSHAAAPPPDVPSYEHRPSADYQHVPFLTAAAAATTSPLLPPLPLPSAAQYHHHHHHHHQQHQHQLYLQQQHQLHMHQQQQLQLQIQLQQQQLAAYGNHPFDLSPVMMAAHNMASPLYVATTSPSSTDSNRFPFCGYDYLPKSAYSFGYPYFDEILDTKGARDCSVGGIGSGLDSSSGGGDGGRSDCMSPESTTPTGHHRRAARMLDDPDVDPEEIAAIYRQSDFVSFRNRYLESLGPPKNFEKMRRSVPNKKLQMNGQHSYDQTYVMKRQKNNEAAKRSRDAKRQKYIENQISVMYLTKKVSEMKEIKRRLLMSM